MVSGYYIWVFYTTFRKIFVYSVQESCKDTENVNIFKVVFKLIKGVGQLYVRIWVVAVGIITLKGKLNQKETALWT